jgi:4-amino-4-deoxy-L-arabinose transferase-like glycosyltransferase
VVVEENKDYKVLLFLFVALIWLYRLLVLGTTEIDLYIDEAYYYNWSQNLDLGYYSKPPMLSLLIAFTTSIFGDGVLAIKLGAQLVYPITTFVIYLIAKEFFDEKIAFYSALTFFTLPSIWLSSLIISTDVVLLLFWSLGLLFFIRSLKSDRFVDWLFAGIFSGLGLLSKYNYIFFLISIILTFVLIKRYRKNFTNGYFYMAMIVALLIFLPNLWWNYQNDFISFVHTKEISHVEGKLLHPNKFFEFFGAQFIVFGPILFFYFWVIVFKREFLKDDRYLILFLFSIVMLGFIMFLSFMSRSFANWAAPTYVAATILVVAYLINRGKTSLVIASIVIHSLLGMALYHYHDLAKLAGVTLSKKSDPYNRVLGWRDVMSQIKDIRSGYRDRLILSKSRGSVAELDYYTKEKTYIFNPNHELENQYHMDRDLNEFKGRDFIYVGSDKDEELLREHFENVTKLKDVSSPIYDDYSRSYSLYLVDGFKGY